MEIKIDLNSFIDFMVDKSKEEGRMFEDSEFVAEFVGGIAEAFKLELEKAYSDYSDNVIDLDL